MDSFAKSIKGDVKITVGTVSAPGSYVPTTVHPFPSHSDKVCLLAQFIYQFMGHNNGINK